MVHAGVDQTGVTQLVLVGLMGAGKSTIGRIVADRLGRQLVDTDDAIQHRTGKSVRELWERGGEAAYRALESSVVVDALRDATPLVVAAPGGVVLDPAARHAMKDAFVVWLDVDPSILATRVRPDDHRPLLGRDPRAVLSTMAVEREHLYREVADTIIELGDDIDPATAAQQVIDAFDRGDTAR